MKEIKFFRSIKPLAIILLLSVFSTISCSKDDDGSPDNQEAIEEADAVDVIESSLAEETNGLAKTVETAVEMADSELVFTYDPTIECDQTYSDSYSENYSNGNYSYNYSVSRTYLLHCNLDGYPEILTYELDFNGVYNTPRMSSDDTTAVDWEISNLGATQTTPTFNGSYLREGTQVSKARNMNTFNSVLTFNLNNLVVSKTTYKILSGTAQVNFVGVSSNGNQYTFSGSLTFNGDNTATLVLNGNTYTINL